jgi:hypothetical protein
LHAADGAVRFLVKLSPALEQLDSSSGSPGGAARAAGDRLGCYIRSVRRSRLRCSGGLNILSVYLRIACRASSTSDSDPLNSRESMSHGGRRTRPATTGIDRFCDTGGQIHRSRPAELILGGRWRPGSPASGTDAHALRQSESRAERA